MKIHQGNERKPPHFNSLTSTLYFTGDTVVQATDHAPVRTPASIHHLPQWVMERLECLPLWGSERLSYLHASPDFH